MIHYRVFTSDKGKFQAPEKYTFIAEFANPDRVRDYIQYLFEKECGGKKDIIIKEVKDNDVSKEEGIVGGVLTSIGEWLLPEEWDL